MIDRRGVSLISLIVVSAMIAGIIFLALQNLRTNDAVAAKVENTVVAEIYATELLELFRSMGSADLAGYLANNPYRPPLNPSGSCSGCTNCTEPACAACRQCERYFLCAHINILDRASAGGTVVNPDPLAALPANNLLDGNTPATKANRFYQVQVIDPITLAADASVCTSNTASISLLASQRFFVTVGVTWVPHGKTVADSERIVMSALIP